MKKTALSIAVGVVLGVASVASYAATVNTGDTLTITAGQPTVVNSVVTSFSGSYFGMDTDGNSKISLSERDALSQGTTGLVIGVTTAAGASHSGVPVAGDTNAIDAPWAFFGNTGSDYVKVGVTGSTASGLNLSGWTVTWNGIPAINMGSGAWQPLNCSALGCTGHTFTDGNAMFTWDGVYGDAYSLNYAATVPAGDPSGFGGVKYYLHLEGVVNPVPLPAAVWLLGSGLIGLVGVARRKRSDQS
ncbi:MAG: VPLPA-CTERM sorting domain-containing protein [Acidiferrobacterales bacterium]